MPLPRQYARLVGSTWTSKTPVLGWRQFHVVSLRRAGSSWEVELAASVEPARRTWIAVADTLPEELADTSFATPR